MNRKENEHDFAVGEKGPVWSVKVGVYSYLLEGSRVKNVKAKRWKIKEILN